MNPTPIIDMFSGTGELARAAFVEWLMGLPTDNAANLSRTARIRLAGNAVVGAQARLMLQRGLDAANETKGTL